MKKVQTTVFCKKCDAVHLFEHRIRNEAALKQKEALILQVFLASHPCGSPKATLTELEKRHDPETGVNVEFIYLENNGAMTFLKEYGEIAVADEENAHDKAEKSG